MTSEYRGRVLSSRCRRRPDGRYSVAVAIELAPIAASPARSSGPVRSAIGRDAAIYRDDGVSFILEVEAELESLALGRRVVDSGGA